MSLSTLPAAVPPMYHPKLLKQCCLCAVRHFLLESWSGSAVRISSGGIALKNNVATHLHERRQRERRRR